jgi:hypothetical protein
MLGIIPAAGKGERWGGFYKELLPIGDNRWLIDNTIDAMKTVGCERICLVTSPEKIHVHVQHFNKEKYKDLNIFFVINKGKEMWDSIVASFPYTEEYNYFAMPDTLYPVDSFPNKISFNIFGMGLFKTDKPERFGILKDGTIMNKMNCFGKKPFTAWGTLCWAKDTYEEFWKDKGIPNYTEAINVILRDGIYLEYVLDYYYDFATFKDYEEYIKNV